MKPDSSFVIRILALIYSQNDNIATYARKEVDKKVIKKMYTNVAGLPSYEDINNATLVDHESNKVVEFFKDLLDSYAVCIIMYGIKLNGVV